MNDTPADRPQAPPRPRPRFYRPLSLLILALALLLFPTCEDSRSRAPKRPNVLIVSIDTLRADHLGCYGYERATSPNLDALAAEGVRFERALASTSWTLPSHVTLFTGLPISAHGICDDRLWTRVDANGAPRKAPLRGTWLAEPLQAGGYRTAGFYSWKYLEPQFGFGPGFETWERMNHSLFSHPETGPRFEELRRRGDIEGMRELAEAHPELPVDEGTPQADRVIDRASQWLEGLEQDEDFFLFVHLFDVHDPYTPPEPYDTLFDPDYTGPIDGRRVTSADSPVHLGMDRRDLHNLIARYDGGIAWVDHQLGRLFQRLEELGRREDTLVIVTSDHGEEFFDHGHKTHRRQLHPESIQVPLIVRWPAAWPEGSTIPGPVGLVDIAPTVYAATRTQAPDDLGGIDLAEAVREGSAPMDRTLLAELFVFDGSGPPERLVNLTRGQEQLLLQTRSEEPWSAQRTDLALDPWGRGAGQPLNEEDQAALEQRLERLGGYLRSLRAAQADLGASLPTLDEHDLQQLASLGYAGLEEAVEAAEETEGRLCIDGCFWR